MIITMMGGTCVATNTSNPQQEANLLEQDNDIGSNEEDNKAIVPESNGQDKTEVLQDITSNLRTS